MADPTDIDLARRDIVALAKGLQALNNYTHRLGNVESICNSILAPNPLEAAAQEDLASFTASRSRLGAITSIICDWDENWHYIFQFRFSDGYWQGDGFDLREGKPGYNALLRALEIAKVDSSICNLTAPEKATTVPSRRVVYPKEAK